MKTLPNGLVVFNSTPHPITFWREDWKEPVSVEPDELINAKAVEVPVNSGGTRHGEDTIWFVRTSFEGTDEGRAIISRVKNQVDVIVGSIIAAQAYPGDVVAMCPAPGYERVAPDQKRMLPDKFTVF